MIKNYLLCFFVFIKLLIHRFLVNPVYDLHRDEYLHLDQADHLAWGFTSVPPFTSWMSLLISALGNDVFWVRFFPALLGALTLIVVWKTVEALGGGLFALCLSATALLFSVVLRLNVLFQPNSADVFFWTLLFYFLIRYLQQGKALWLILGGVAFGFGFLNKYNIVFQVLGLLPALLLTGQYRIFTRKAFGIALAAALVIMLPNLIWQYNHDFPVITHMRLLSKYQLVNVSRADFFKEQLLYFYGSVFLFPLALLSFYRYAPFKPYRPLFWSFLFTLGLFVFFKAKSYYAIGLYPVYLAFGAVYLAHLTKTTKWQPVLRGTAITLPVLAMIPLFRLAFPIDTPSRILENAETFKKLGLLRWEDGKDHHLPQDFADMLGWKELAAKTDAVYEKLEDKAHTLILCDNYGQAGAINYYSRYPEVRAVSMNADYINWMDLDSYEIRHVILVQDAGDDDKERNKEKPLFESVSYEGRIEDRNAREFDTRIYLLKGAKVSVNAILKEDREREKW